MTELDIILKFLTQHGSALVVFIFALLIFLEKFFGTVTNLNDRFGFETKKSLEQKNQKELINQQKVLVEQHTASLDKLTRILDEQNKDIQVIKDLMKEQANMFCDQKTDMEQLFKNTTSFSDRLDTMSIKLEKACDLDKILEEGVVAILRDTIEQAHRYYMPKGYISTTGLENISAIYHVYSDKLHENGVGEKMYNEIRSLPIRNLEDVNNSKGDIL